MTELSPGDVYKMENGKKKINAINNQEAQA